MTITAPGGTFTPYVTNAPTGDAGSIGFALYDPATATYPIPRFTAGIYELVDPDQPSGTGIYYAPAQTAPDTAGVYQMIWDSPASPPNAVDDLVVSWSALINQDLCTLPDVRAAIRIVTTAEDELIQTSISGASAAIAARYQRQFAPIADIVTEAFKVTGRLVDLCPCDLRTATPPVITLDPDGDNELVLVSTDYSLEPMRASSGTYYRLRLRRGLQLPSMSDFGYGKLTIEALWGFPAILENVRRAAVITAAAWIDRGAESYAQPNMDTDGPNPYPARPETWAIPSAAHSLLQRYERMVVA